jgi:hypothetical protein
MALIVCLTALGASCSSDDADPCAPLRSERLDAIQTVVDAAASQTLAELAALESAPDIVADLRDPGPVGAALIEGQSLDELSAEERAEIEAQQSLREKCWVDMFLSPYTEAKHLDFGSAAGAVAWALFHGYTTFVPFDAEFDAEITAEIEALFGQPPEPGNPDLPSVQDLSCDALVSATMDAAQSLIDNHAYDPWNSTGEIDPWLESVEQAATDAGCTKPFFSRTVAGYGHTLSFDDPYSIELTVRLISFSWYDSWETFRS